MENPNKKILCIDDNNDTCEMVKLVFEHIGFEVVTSASADEGLLHARRGGFRAIILDNRFDKITGVEVCREVRSFDSTTPIVFLSGEARPNEIEKALAAGANAYLVKPQDFEKLEQTVIDLTAFNKGLVS